MMSIALLTLHYTGNRLSHFPRQSMKVTPTQFYAMSILCSILACWISIHAVTFYRHNYIKEYYSSKVPDIINLDPRSTGKLCQLNGCFSTLRCVGAAVDGLPSSMINHCMRTTINTWRVKSHDINFITLRNKKYMCSNKLANKSLFP